jgi:hypothetical protein
VTRDGLEGPSRLVHLLASGAAQGSVVPSDRAGPERAAGQRGEGTRPLGLVPEVLVALESAVGGSDPTEAIPLSVDGRRTHGSTVEDGSLSLQFFGLGGGAVVLGSAGATLCDHEGCRGETGQEDLGGRNSYWGSHAPA